MSNCTHWDFFTSFHVSPCCSLTWVHAVSGFQIATYLGGFVSYKLFNVCASFWVSYCHSVGCFHGVPDVSLPRVAPCSFRYTIELTGVALLHFMCLTAAHLCGFRSSKVHHCYSLGWIHFILVSQFCSLELGQVLSSV